MFKKAYVRGIAKALMDTGAVKFANEDEAIAAADQVAEQMPEQPVGEVAPEATAELATNLIDLSNSLQQSAESAAQAATAVAGDGGAAKAASLNKAAMLLRKKLAVDTGSTIVGDRPEQENRSSNSPNAEARLDEKNRPGGDSYANVGEDGVGGQQDSGKGAIGSEKKRTEGTGMGPAEGGSNSATEAVKGASLRNIIKAAAMGKKAEVPGTTIDGTKAVADARTGEGEMEKNRRPAGYAAKGVDGVGQSDEAAKERAAAVGTETPHPGQESHEGGTNTAIKQSEDEQYIRELRVLGQKYASRLPVFMLDTEKVAALQYLKGLPPTEREMVVSHIEKTAEMPEGLKKYLDAKKGEGGEKKDEAKGHEESETPAEEKKEEAAKKASARPKGDSILARLRQMNATQ